MNSDNSKPETATSSALGGEIVAPATALATKLNSYGQERMRAMQVGDVDRADAVSRDIGNYIVGNIGSLAAIADIPDDAVAGNPVLDVTRRRAVSVLNGDVTPPLARNEDYLSDKAINFTALGFNASYDAAQLVQMQKAGRIGVFENAILETAREMSVVEYPNGKFSYDFDKGGGNDYVRFATRWGREVARANKDASARDGTATANALRAAYSFGRNEAERDDAMSSIISYTEPLATDVHHHNKLMDGVAKGFQRASLYAQGAAEKAAAAAESGKVAGTPPNVDAWLASGAPQSIMKHVMTTLASSSARTGAVANEDDAAKLVANAMLVFASMADNLSSAGAVGPDKIDTIAEIAVYNATPARDKQELRGSALRLHSTMSASQSVVSSVASDWGRGAYGQLSASVAPIALAPTIAFVQELAADSTRDSMWTDEFKKAVKDIEDPETRAMLAGRGGPVALAYLSSTTKGREHLKKMQKAGALATDVYDGLISNWEKGFEQAVVAFAAAYGVESEVARTAMAFSSSGITLNDGDSLEIIAADVKKWQDIIDRGDASGPKQLLDTARSLQAVAAGLWADELDEAAQADMKKKLAEAEAFFRMNAVEVTKRQDDLLKEVQVTTIDPIKQKLTDNAGALEAKQAEYKARYDAASPTGKQKVLDEYKFEVKAFLWPLGDGKTYIEGQGGSLVSDAYYVFDRALDKYFASIGLPTDKAEDDKTEPFVRTLDDPFDDAALFSMMRDEAIDRARPKWYRYDGPASDKKYADFVDPEALSQHLATLKEVGALAKSGADDVRFKYDSMLGEHGMKPEDVTAVRQRLVKVAGSPKLDKAKKNAREMADRLNKNASTPSEIQLVARWYSDFVDKVDSATSPEEIGLLMSQRGLGKALSTAKGEDEGARAVAKEKTKIDAGVTKAPGEQDEAEPVKTEETAS